MYVYRPQDIDTPVHTMFVQPGHEYPVSHFMQDGKPILFTVTFKSGRAEVMDSLGEYMINSGIANRSPIIVPAGYRHQKAQTK